MFFINIITFTINKASTNRVKYLFMFTVIRKHTFKLAYTQMHRWLDTPEYRSRREEKGRKGRKKKKSS